LPPDLSVANITIAIFGFHILVSHSPDGFGGVAAIIAFASCSCTSSRRFKIAQFWQVARSLCGSVLVTSFNGFFVDVDGMISPDKRIS
jgi:hypothetical protein